ncbi:MAG: DUF2281 domain-containing protein [Anaerolineae bacterium]|nr:DUF2281 domain-containing protein [Anaerolineae bacterium]
MGIQLGSQIFRIDSSGKLVPDDPEARSLEATVRTLPIEAQREVWDFVEFLVEKWTRKEQGEQAAESSGPLRQDWAGALRDYRAQYTSLELEQKALEWRGD